MEQRQILPAVFTVADAHSPFPRRPLHRMNPITQEQYNIYILAYIAYYPFLCVCASARDYHQINVIIFFFFLFDLIRWATMWMASQREVSRWTAGNRFLFLFSLSSICDVVIHVDRSYNEAHYFYTILLIWNPWDHCFTSSSSCRLFMVFMWMILFFTKDIIRCTRHIYFVITVWISTFDTFIGIIYSSVCYYRTWIYPVLVGKN